MNPAAATQASTSALSQVEAVFAALRKSVTSGEELQASVFGTYAVSLKVLARVFISRLRYDEKATLPPRSGQHVALWPNTVYKQLLLQQVTCQLLMGEYSVVVRHLLGH